eukprot:TRINITY_DN95627_c0_g1_i1.p1 TRINITY_DN95627_c0_g1~~TRINITY_DN95627_c0_g1_i1.p1  ORF type:complete len:140 (-),score=24.39 TRINITY_DN95627_c0_g1_i1:52-471(-)
MGAEASRPVVEGGKKASKLLRQAGEPLNTLGYPVVHERTLVNPTGKPVRMTICRCWQSLRFPLCDNTHQRLQKEGVNVGPVMLEVKPGQSITVPGNVGACCEAPPSRLANLGGTQAAMLGGAAAAGLAGAVTYFGGFPM